MLVTDICLSVSFQKMFLQLISANRQNTLFNYAFHKSSLFSIFFYVFSKKLLTTSAFSCIVHYVVEMQRNFIIKVVQEWRNWQTRRLQVPVVAISCGFKSRFLHYFFYADLFSHVSIYHTLPLVQIIQLFTQYPFRIPVHVFLT